jgi:DNA polymerase-3 subunit beta
MRSAHSNGFRHFSTEFFSTASISSKIIFFSFKNELFPIFHRKETTAMMKFSCEKALLQSAIAVTSRAVAPKSSIPALEGLLLRAGQELTVSGYNMNTGIRTKLSAGVDEAGEIVLNARLFGDIIRRMPDDMITFSADERQMVHLSCGDADFDILGLSAADYPDLPEVEDEYAVSIQQRVLRSMIEETAFAVSTNESRPVHTGALFEINERGLTMVAVDGFRLAVRREPLEQLAGGAFSFVAPGAALNEVKSICSDTEDTASVTLGRRHILFEVGDTELICRRLEGEFLDYKNAIPRANPISMVAETKSLIESIDRVSVVISDKLKSPVRCVFDHDKVMLSAKTGNGEAKDVCRLSGDGGGLEIGFNNRYLMEALRYAPADTVKIELNTGVSPAIIVPTDEKDNFLYMVLPVRLKSAE